PAAVDALNLDGCALLHAVRGERHFILVGLCVDGIARPLVHWRGEQAAALRCEIELVADSFRERQSLEVGPWRRIEGDDRAPLWLQPDRPGTGELRNFVSPRAGGVDEQRCRVGFAFLRRDLPRT